MTPFTNQQGRYWTCYTKVLPLIVYCFGSDKLSNFIDDLQLRLFHLRLCLCLMKSPRCCHDAVLPRYTSFSHLIMSYKFGVVKYKRLCRDQLIIGHLGCNGTTSSGQDILRVTFSFDDLLVSASWEVLLLNPASKSFPNLDPFLPVDGSEEVELLNRLFLLRCRALPE